MIKYEFAGEIRALAEKIVKVLDWNYIDMEEVSFIRSYGSKSRGTIARCHGLGKAMQIGLQRKKAFYVIEVISHRFDKMSNEDKIKTTIHELMHIPKSFGGGFKHHDVVTERTVNMYYKIFLDLLNQEKNGI